MPQVIDNLIAYRVLSMLVTPFKDSEAYKLGIIDDKGKNLIKARDLKTPEQKNAYTYLHRLVFNLKKLLNQVPGGDNYTKNLIAAFFLIKESYPQRTLTVDLDKLQHLIGIQDNGVVLAQEQLIVEEFLTLAEDAPANVTGAGVSTNTPVVRRAPRRFSKFIVNDDVYKKFSNGKAKLRKWSEYLNLEDEGQREIYKFAKSNPNGVIVLQNGKQTKAIRFNRVGGGTWSKIKRPSKQINNNIV